MELLSATPRSSVNAGSRTWSSTLGAVEGGGQIQEESLFVEVGDDGEGG